MPNDNETPSRPTQGTTESRPSQPPSATVGRLDQSRGLTSRIQSGLEKLYDVPESISGRKRETRNIRGTDNAERTKFVAEVDATARKSWQLLTYFRQHPENLSRFIDEQLIGKTGEISRENMVSGYVSLEAWHKEFELDIANSRSRQSEIVAEMARAQGRVAESPRTPPEQARYEAWQEITTTISSLPERQQAYNRHSLLGVEVRAYENLRRTFDTDVIPSLNGDFERARIDTLEDQAHPESVTRHLEAVQTETEDLEQEHAPLISKYRQEGQEVVKEAAAIDSLSPEQRQIFESQQRIDRKYDSAIESMSQGRLTNAARGVLLSKLKEAHPAVSEYRRLERAGQRIPDNIREKFDHYRDIEERIYQHVGIGREILNDPTIDPATGEPAVFGRLEIKLQSVALGGTINPEGVTELLRDLKTFEEEGVYKDVSREEHVEALTQARIANAETRQLNDAEIAKKIGGRYWELWQQRETALGMQTLYEKDQAASGLSPKMYNEYIRLERRHTAGLPLTLKEHQRLARLGGIYTTDLSAAEQNRLLALEAQHKSQIQKERQRLGRRIAVKETPEYQQMVVVLNSPAVREAIAGNAPLTEVPEYTRLQQQLGQRLSDMETEEEKDLRILRQEHRDEGVNIQTAQEMQQTIEPVLGTLERKIVEEHGQGFLRAVQHRTQMLQRRMEQHRALQAALQGESPEASQAAEYAKRGLEFSQELAGSAIEEIVQMLMEQFGMPEEEARRRAPQIRRQMSLWSILVDVIFPALEKMSAAKRRR